MTGLERLISFLNERNVLSLGEIALLERRGIWTRVSEHGDFEAVEIPRPCDPDQDDYLYRLELPIRRRRKGRRRRRRGARSAVRKSTQPAEVIHQLADPK